MTDLIQQFRQFVTEQQLLPPPNNTLLLAVSGGIDSTVLCELFHQTALPFAIAHCNFGLRKQESDEDADFVEQLARHQYEVPFHSIRFDTQQQADLQNVSIQMAARQLRYDWFKHLCQTHHYYYIATAHHQNDIMETMLYNLTKGTGIAGLHGILPKQGQLIRPLLFATKADIETYAHHQALPFRHDSSNDQTKYARNKIRQLVVPVLQDINPNVVHTFYENANRLAEVETIYQQAIEQYKKRLLQTEDAQNYSISIARLTALQPLTTILYELLKDFGFTNAQLPDIIHALSGETGKLFLSASHQLLKDRKHLLITPRTKEQAPFCFINEIQTEAHCAAFILQITVLPNTNYAINNSPNIAALDHSKLSFPLRLRLWQEGDYFYPLGMNRKKKKVSRFFSDQKLNRNQKKQTWILEDSNQRIVWIVGHRIDERFKVTDKTQQIYQINLNV